VSQPKRLKNAGLYALRRCPYTLWVTFFREKLRSLPLLWAAVALPIIVPYVGRLATQDEKATKTQQEKPVAPQLPFEIQLLETHIRFEIKGDSRKEVHTIVKLNNVLGARQFSRIAFDYNRGYQQVDIPEVRISHANGGTSELLPSAVTDSPSPAVERYPAYQDVRVKAVRILGLQEGDTVEYRVITTTTHPPLAPDFWLEHTFDRSGQVLEEHYELDLPQERKVEMYNSPAAQPAKKEQTGEGGASRVLYTWTMSAPKAKESDAEAGKAEPDVVLTTFPTWEQFAEHLGQQLVPNQDSVNSVNEKAKEITHSEKPSANWIPLLYDFVSRKIVTVDLPLGSTGFRTRAPAEILSSGYATPEDKFVLFAALAKNCCKTQAGLVHASEAIPSEGLPRPTVFDHLLAVSGHFAPGVWMDLNLEVAPFGMIPSQFRGKRALAVNPDSNQPWIKVSEVVPFKGLQRVAVEAVLNKSGDLTAKVKYTMRGDNELLLRVAFHQTAKEKWKDVAGLLAISDGFRGQVTSVTVSDPKGTKDPFVVEYDLTQPKFVDWTKKPVRIPALLPQIALPDPPSANAAKIDLGTPLDVDTRLTLRLPTGTTIQAPAGTSVTRDYATFSSSYAANGSSLTASRHVNFLAKQIQGDRVTDYTSFLRVVQSDQVQFFTLVPPSAAEAAKAEGKKNPQ
jgi:Domain of Unknown Function with PDB structure (DUF3857)